jgi:uncharacterized membrane protein YeaQ/YmgE (transglycosylase-associated protein family)
MRGLAAVRSIIRTRAKEERTMLWWIIVGIIAGWAAGKIMKGSGYGVLWDLVLGVVGAIVGGWLVSLVGLSPQGGLIWSILVAILGAVIVVWIFRLVTGRRRAV